MQYGYGNTIAYGLMAISSKKIGGVVMTINKRYAYSKCPHCGKYTISYRQKMKLVDYRYCHACKECGGNIQLPAWHAVLYLCEIIILIIVVDNLNMNTWQAILSGVALLLFISLVQLPLIPIRG